MALAANNDACFVCAELVLNSSPARQAKKRQSQFLGLCYINADIRHTSLLWRVFRLTKKLIIKANAELLRLISKFQAKEAHRYYLCGVNFEKHPDGGLIMVATDGHRLASIHDPDGKITGADSAIIQITPAIYNALGQKKTREFHQRGNLSHVVMTGNIDDAIDDIGMNHVYSCYNKPVDGTFPDWRRVVPKTFTSVSEMCFQTRYLAGFATLLPKGDNGMEVYFSGKDQPTIFRLSRYKDFLGVLMPMRGLGCGPHPEWFKQ